jgi:hypothetical protein
VLSFEDKEVGVVLEGSEGLLEVGVVTAAVGCDMGRACCALL